MHTEGTQIDKLLSRRPIDMVQIIEAYPEPIRKLILGRTTSFEMTNGCTGGCSWCGLNVQRHITEGFSIESAESFSKKYARYLTNQIQFYWATDPGDIAGYRTDGTKYDYSDLLAVTLPFLNTDQAISTSTSLPLGTDEAMERTYKLFYQEWTKGKRHPIRISIKPEVQDRVEVLRRRLIVSGIDEEYINWQFSHNVTRSEDGETIQYVGKYIKHPNRNPLVSSASNSVACYDGCLFTTKGVKSITVEAVTAKNQFGETQTFLDPNAEYFAIPRPMSVFPHRAEQLSSYISSGLSDRISRLPDIAVDVFDRNGNRVETKTIPSVRRDLLSMIYLFEALSLIARYPEPKRFISNLFSVGLDICVSLAFQLAFRAQEKYIKSCDDPDALNLLSKFFIGVKDVESQIRRDFTKVYSFPHAQSEPRI